MRFDAAAAERNLVALVAIYIFSKQNVLVGANARGLVLCARCSSGGGVTANRQFVTDVYMAAWQHAGPAVVGVRLSHPTAANGLDDGFAVTRTVSGR